MKLKHKKVKILCSNCKTGEESYALEPDSFACPYLHCRNEYDCAYFVPIKISNNKNEDEGLFKKILKKIIKDR